MYIKGKLPAMVCRLTSSPARPNQHHLFGSQGPKLQFDAVNEMFCSDSTALRKQRSHLDNKSEGTYQSYA